MNWSVLLGILSGLATAALLAPWGAQPAPRSLTDVGQTSPVAPVRMRRRSRRRDALTDDLTVQRYLETLSRSVRAGRTLNQALDDLAERSVQASARRWLHETLWLASHAGTGPATVLERGAVMAADRVAARQERRAQAAQARLSATVLTWVPVGVCALAVAVDDHVRRMVFTTPLGWLCLIAGGGLSTLGRWWIRRITEGVPP